MKTIKKTMFFLFTLFILVCLIAFICYLLPKPKISKSNVITVFDKNNEVLIQTHYDVVGDYVEIDEINENFIICFICSEDEDFYSHNGFSFKGIVRALISNIKNDTTQGGSTISQQLSRSLFLNNEKSIFRKIKEAFITLRIEMHYDKKEIIEQYLNNIYLGHNIYGIEQASLYYFNKSNKLLTLDEVAMIVGIANAPNINAPDINFDNAMSRRNYVINRLYDEEFIDKSTKDSLIRKKTIININKLQFENINMPILHYIKNKLIELKLDEKKIYAQGIKVYTTIDSNIQKINYETISKNNPNDNSEISSIVMDVNSGDILSIYGGYDINEQYNRAIYSTRPIGSTIKPLLYYLALSCGMNPLTFLSCNKMDFNVKGFETYSPTNASNKYATNKINMIEAIGLSDNIYATKTLLYVGFDNFTKLLKLFNVDINCVPSSALGVDEMSLLKLTSIYNTFASLGYYYTPRLIKEITLYNDERLYKSLTHKKKVLNKNTLFVLNQLLTAPFDDNLIDYTTPTLLFYKPNTLFAGKTGSNETNSYTIGFNPNYTISVWTGTDNNEYFSSHNVSKKVFLNLANSINNENIWYTPNDNIKKVKINPITGSYDNNGSIYWI